jgi:hypothetical protein
MTHDGLTELMKHKKEMESYQEYIPAHLQNANVTFCWDIGLKQIKTRTELERK